MSSTMRGFPAESLMDPVQPISPSQSRKEDRGSSRVVHTFARSISGRTGGEGGSCLGSQQSAAWQLQSKREAERPAEGVPGRGPGPQLCSLSEAGAEPAAPDAAGVAQGSDPG